MAEAKGLMKPVKLKKELAELLDTAELPRTEVTKKLWDYIKANKLQTKIENGKPENAGSRDALWLAGAARQNVASVDFLDNAKGDYIIGMNPDSNWQ